MIEENQDTSAAEDIDATQESKADRPRIGQRIAARTRATRLLLTDTSVILLILVPILTVIFSIQKQNVVIAEISLPSALEEKGYFSPVVGRKLYDNIIAIQKTSRTSREMTAFNYEAEKIEIAASRLIPSASEILRYFRSIFGYGALRITGDIICAGASCTDSPLRAEFRITGAGKRVQIQPVEAATIEDLLTKIADVLMQEIDPFILATTIDGENPERALNLIKKAMSNDIKEDDKWALNLRGIIYKNIGEVIKSAEAYDTVIKLAPDFVLPFNNMGVLLIEGGKPERAKQLFLQALEIDNEYALAHANLGRILFNSGDYEAALIKFRHALELEPSNSFIIGKFTDTLDKMGRYQEEEEVFVTAISLPKTHISIRSKYSNFLLRQKRRPAALAEFRNVRKLDPENAWAYRAEISYLITDKDYEQARSLIEEAFLLGKDLHIIHAYNGQIERETGNIAEAKKQYLEALKVKANYELAYHALYNFYEKEKNFKEAEKILLVGQKALPNSALIWKLLAFVYEDSKRTDLAISAYEKAAEYTPEDKELLKDWARYLNIIGRTHDAEQKYLLALDVDPHYGDALNSLGNLYRVNSRYDEAKAMLLKAIETNPKFPRPYWNMGDMLQDRGKLQEALPYFEKYVTLDPDSYFGRKAKAYLDQK